MNIFQSILFFLSLALLIIGAHQTFTVGFYESYWLFMLSLVLFFIYGAMKKNNVSSNDKENNSISKDKNKDQDGNTGHNK